MHGSGLQSHGFVEKAYSALLLPLPSHAKKSCSVTGISVKKYKNNKEGENGKWINLLLTRRSQRINISTP